MGEPRQEFERELETIEGKVIQLFAMVGEDLNEATRALQAGDGEVFTVLLERDQEIDALYLEVEELVQREILLQAPVASDLRFLLSVLRITPELERSHDLIVQIAASAGNAPARALSPAGQAMLTRMGELAAEMWGQTSDCWYQRDRSTAARLTIKDQEMDGLHARLHAELAAGGLPVPAIMELTLVTRFYERLGAHAVNVSRRVIYLAGPKRDLPAAPRRERASPRAWPFRRGSGPNRSGR